jgi:hypothetical protein
VAVGNVVDYLAHGPSSVAIWSVELRAIKSHNGIAKVFGCGSETFDHARAIFGRKRTFAIKLSNWKSGISHTNRSSTLCGNLKLPQPRAQP